MSGERAAESRGQSHGRGTDGSRRSDGRLSPTLATTFLGCRQAAAWEMDRKRDAGGETGDDAPDEMGQLILERGRMHEAAVLEALQAEHGDRLAVIVEGQPKGGGPEQDKAIDDTRRAMGDGAAFIHQAALEWTVPSPDGGEARWFGYADFLRRVDRPSRLGEWSYEPWDAKLTTRAKPSHLLQLCIYAEMVERVQGRAPEHVGLMLGTGAESGDFGLSSPGAGEVLAVGDRARLALFPLAEFRYYARRVSHRVAGFRAGMPHADLDPRPCASCEQCRFAVRCERLWDDADHLCRVADISKAQMRRLEAADIVTRQALARVDIPDAVSGRVDGTTWGIADATLRRLAQQARLQEETAARTGRDDLERDAPPVPATELLPAAPGRGLARLPEPDVADVWFDFEGDPLEPGGLDYLNGVLVRAEAVEGATAEGFQPVTHGGAPTPYLFRAFWAHGREEEGRAFAAFMDWQEAHFARHPNAHLYHYAPYEKTALRRMASLHATHEDALDRLLRENRLVDLYRAVREGVRVGADSYSIKSLEPLYMGVREADTKGGGASVAVYHQWRDTGEACLLDDIEHYNREDCVSTVRLHDWLLGRARDAGIELGTGEAATEAREERRRERRAANRTEKQRANDERRAERNRAVKEEARALHAALAPREGENETRVRSLCRDLSQFHAREDKPVWWEFFDRLDTDGDGLIEDMDCLGGLTADRSCWGVPDTKSEMFRFHVPEQQTKLAPGTRGVTIAAVADDLGEWEGEGAGTIEEYDADAGTLTLKRARRVDGSHVPPEALSLIPGGPIERPDIVARTTEVVRDVADGGDAYPHLARFLHREPPRIAGHAEGAPVVPDDARDPDAVLAATIRAALGLDRSWLAIQGPPGTGKTHTLARVIEALVASGKRVGVTANSHKVIDNVLTKVERHWAELGLTKGQRLGQKMGGDGSFKSHDGSGHIDKVDKAEKLNASVVGGTAWAFANEHFTHPANRLDVLVVDEAGQVSLGMLLAAASAARNVILVGDPMQLPQPLKGSHPGESGMSCLEYVLEEDPVLPPEKGVFLATTWRMHPDLCGWVSDAVYAGRLTAEAGCAAQRLVPGEGADPALRPTGLSFVEVAHEGRTQSSEEEAGRVVSLVRDLMASDVVDRSGVHRSMHPAAPGRGSVLVVSPYNMQVRLLRRRLDEAGFADVPVGTVDKFQGQEAEAVVVSMATSDAEHMPRDASFLLSRNRLNVAVSRARCLALIVASPGLLDLNASSVPEMRLANLLCWAAEAGRAA